MSTQNNSQMVANVMTHIAEEYALDRAKFVEKLSSGHPADMMVDAMMRISAQDKFLRIFASELEVLANVAVSDLDPESIDKAVGMFKRELDNQIDFWTPLSSTSNAQVEANNAYFTILKNTRRMF